MKDSPEVIDAIVWAIQECYGNGHEEMAIHLAEQSALTFTQLAKGLARSDYLFDEITEMLYDCDLKKADG